MSAPRSTWAIITGEYPPQPGGVSDYTRMVALGLARDGDEVHVWAPETIQRTPEECGVKVHRIAGGFGLQNLSAISAALRHLPPSSRILVQYVSQAYGWKGMNIPFCLWLATRKQPVWVLFHEVAFPFRRSQSPHLNFLALVTHGMASLIAPFAQRVFVSIPAWEQMLAFTPRVEWLPIPSTVSTSVDSRAVAEVRKRLAPVSPEGVVIGHFGTYGVHITPLLNQILPPLLTADARRRVHLLGGGGAEYAADFRESFPCFSDRITAPGKLPGAEVATHLAACDLLIQPYADGVSTRRTSVMAGLALGLPILTTEGHLTEPVWAESRAVELVLALAPQEFVRAAERLLCSPEYRLELGARAAALYRDRFDLANTIRALRA